MIDKKYTHKIVMYDVNGLVRTAQFTNEKEALLFRGNTFKGVMVASDNEGKIFNLDNIVQINPVEVLKGNPSEMSNLLHNFIHQNKKNGFEEVVRKTNKEVAGEDIDALITLDDGFGEKYFYQCMEIAENIMRSFEKDNIEE